MENKPDYDALFEQSQQNRFAKPGDEQKTRFDTLYRQSYEKKRREKTPENPQVLDATGRPIRQPKKTLSPELCGMISMITGGVAFVLVFVGMFFHLLLWLNLLICFAGAGFGAAAIIKGNVGRLFGIIGVVLCLFVLLVNFICLIITAVISGTSALFKIMS